LWGGIDVLPNGIFSAFDSSIEGAVEGIYLESTLANTNLLEIKDCTSSAIIVGVEQCI